MVKSAHGSQYNIQPLFGGDWLKNWLKRCHFTKRTTSGPKIEKQRTIHTDGFVSTKNPRKARFTPASLDFCGAGPTETEPSHCSFLQTMHRGAPIPLNGLNLRF